MKKINTPASCVISILLMIAPVSIHAEDQSGHPLTLKDCFVKAVNQSEQLLINQENIEQSKALRRQAVGAILPNVRWSLDAIIQDSNGENADGSSNPLLKPRRTDSRFTATQPLFQGFKEFATMNAYKAQERKNEADLLHQTIQLYSDVSTAFYRVLQLEQFERDTNTAIRLTEDRLKELQGRIRLGKSRPSEVLSQESQLASLRAQEATSQGQIVTAREDLTYLMGVDVSSVTLIDDLSIPSDIEPQEKLESMGLNRSDIRALQEDVNAQRYAIKVAKSYYYPGAGLTGNYYTQRTGFQSDIDWDVDLNVNVPIYQGGSVKALVWEAKSRLKQSELELSRSIRSAESQIREARASLVSSLRQWTLLQAAFQKARESYEAQVKEYRLGSVDNLQVITALDTLQEVKARYDTAFLQSKLNLIRLKVETEELP